MGLSKECAAMDISLGCSGWVYGLSAVAGMMSNGMLKKCLLISDFINEENKVQRV